MGKPPPLSPETSRAIHCWRFCGGWAPERLPLYAALYDVPDWHQLIDLLQEIRDRGH